MSDATHTPADPTSPADLTFLPQPWRVTRDDGWLLLDARTPIRIAAGASEATRRAARSLQAAMIVQTGLHLPLEGAGVGPSAAGGRTIPGVTLVLAGRDDAVFPQDETGWLDPAHLGPQGSTVTVTESGATVAATDEAGLFYGVQTLIQLVKGHDRRWPAVRIEDRPALPVRGLMLDVTRGKVLTIDTLTGLIETIAHYKMNQLQLYIEHTFRFPSHPEISEGSSPLTGDDLLTLGALCRERHIAFVPNFQALGHHRRALSLPQHAHLAETDWRWSFSSADDEAFAFIDGLFAEFLPNFAADGPAVSGRSAWLNVDADEPWDMGLGRSKVLTDEIGVGRVYIQHITRLRELSEKHGRGMMMWADVFWHHPDLIGEVPEDILLLDWWYEVKERYETVARITAAGRRCYVCPGTSSWISLFPRLETAIANIRGFVRDGLAAGAEGMLLTDWGDGGHYQMLSGSWYPFLWGAECGWTGGETESDAFDLAFGRLFLGDYTGETVAALRRLGAAMQTHPEYRRTWNTPMALWEEPLVGTLSLASTPEEAAETRAAAEALFPLLNRVVDPGIRADLGFTARLIVFACAKIETTRAIRATLADLDLVEHGGGSGEHARHALDGLITALEAQHAAIPALVAEFTERWMAHARRSEIRTVLARYAGLRARYAPALAWLRAQREAAAAGLPIDAALGTYDTGGYAVLYQESLKDIVRLAEIVGRENLPPDIQGWLAAHGTSGAE